MWKVLWDVWNGLWTLLRNSPFAFWLSLALIAVSLVELFTKNTWWKERGLKVTVAVISVVLLIVQALASGKASEKEAANLNTALTQQRNELTQTLTQAFTVGTNKILEVQRRLPSKLERVRGIKRTQFGDRRHRI